MNTSHVYLGFIATVILSVNVPAWGQTKEETKKFLVEKCANKWSDELVPELLKEERLAGRPHADGKNYYLNSVSFDGDRFVFTIKGYTTSTDKLFSEDVYSGNLADLNPNQVTTSFNKYKNIYGVGVEATGRKNKMTWEYGIVGEKQTVHTRYSVTAVDGLDERTAAQVNKALKHLITLSGGKGELFEEDKKASDTKNVDAERSSKNKTGSNAGATSTVSPSPKAGKGDSKSRATKEIKVTIPKTIIPKDAKVSWTQYGLSDAINTSAYSNATKGADGSFSIKCKPNVPLWIKVNDGKAKRIDVADKDKIVERLP